MSTVKVEIKKCLSILPPKYSDIVKEINLDNSGSVYYIQHLKEDVEKAQTDFLKICDKELGTNLNTNGVVHRLGIVGRILSDSDNTLYHYWNRFMCIDEKYREWQQPHYCFNIDKYEDKAICLNDMSSILIRHFRNSKIDNILKN